MKRIIVLFSLVSLLVLAFSLTLSAETTQIPQGSEMYAPLTFNMHIERSEAPTGAELIPSTIITEQYTPSVRSSLANSTQYFDGYYYLPDNSPADDFARLSYYIRDEYVFDYPAFDLTYSLDPVWLDVSSLLSDYGNDLYSYFPVFHLTTNVASRIVINASITSVDPSGTARDTVSRTDVYEGGSGLSMIRFIDYLPEFQEGDKVYINEFYIACTGYSPGVYDRYTTGFFSDTYTEPIDANNSPTRVELSSVPLVSILWNSIVDVFEIDLIPGLSLGTILLAIVGLPLLVWFLKLVAGG